MHLKQKNYRLLLNNCNMDNCSVSLDQVKETLDIAMDMWLKGNPKSFKVPGTDINVICDRNKNMGIPNIYKMDSADISQLKTWWEQQYKSQSAELRPKQMKDRRTGTFGVNAVANGGFNFHIPVTDP